MFSVNHLLSVHLQSNLILPHFGKVLYIKRVKKPVFMQVTVFRNAYNAKQMKVYILTIYMNLT